MSRASHVEDDAASDGPPALREDTDTELDGTHSLGEMESDDDEVEMSDNYLPAVQNPGATRRRMENVIVMRFDRLLFMRFVPTSFSSRHSSRR